MRPPPRISYQLPVKMKPMATMLSPIFPLGVHWTFHGGPRRANYFLNPVYKCPEIRPKIPEMQPKSPEVPIIPEILKKIVIHEI